jgi:hypothetical protein
MHSSEVTTGSTFGARFDAGDSRGDVGVALLAENLSVPLRFVPAGWGRRCQRLDQTCQQ